MAVKYSCTKCEKRFVEWGAKKIKAGKGCPDCDGEFLELVGFDAAKAAVKKKPALKRRRKVAAATGVPVKTDLNDKVEIDPAAEAGATAGPEESTEDAGKLDGNGSKP